MTFTTDLIAQIYEASVAVERWPEVLQAIADQVGAKVCLFMSQSPLGVDWWCSQQAEQDMAEYVAQGWASDTAFAAPLIAELWPGFRTETDYRTIEEIAALPVHAEFLDPRGLSAGMGTIVQGAGNAVLQIALQGFASHKAAVLAVPAMDKIRPHLGRAVGLTALLKTRSQVITDSLAIVGVPAAIISRDGRFQVANDLFRDRMESRMSEVFGRLRFADPFLARQIEAALAEVGSGRSSVQSVAVAADPPAPACAIHILPVVGAARDLCNADGIMLVVAHPSNRTLPSADLLRLMFDLTPAEARIARLIASGHSVADAASRCGIQPNTARAHLKSIYAKTGFSRQAELAVNFGALGLPEGA